MDSTGIDDLLVLFNFKCQWQCPGYVVWLYFIVVLGLIECGHFQFHRWLVREREQERELCNVIIFVMFDW